MESQFNTISAKRRSIYDLGDKLTNSPEEIFHLVKETVRKIVKDPAAFQKTQEKIASFRAGFGTVLYLTDTAIVHQLEEQFPTYADNFADWAEQAIGGAQQAVWTALAENNIGASLQHYNPLIDDAIHQAFDLPETWKLRAEMPFGSIEAPASDKDYLPEEQVFKLIK